MEQPNSDRIQEIFDAALARPLAERKAFVAEACQHDAACVREVNSLLEAHNSVGVFLGRPIVELGFSEPEEVNSSADNLVGEMIDERYFIERELGPGGMSRLYLAHDRRLNNRAVVLKFLDREVLENSYLRQKFKQEVEALSRIQHDGVVRVLDQGELADGRPYIVMEYIDGETLQSQIPVEGMNLERAASILEQIGAALEHVHEKGIFHRDLKPANIMLRRNTDSVVLVDFGIAKVKESVVAPSTVGGAPIGTVLYMSPEQLRGEQITAATDIYSMAVMAYEMVTGRLPFNPTSPADLLELQRAGTRAKPSDLRPNLPPHAQDIILRGLSFKPRARFENASEFGDNLARALLEFRLPPKNKQWLKVIGASLMILASVALLSFGIYKYLNRTGNVGPVRSFTYWVTVQKMRDGKEYQGPYKANDNETFELGDKFRLSVSSPAPGYLYIFTEGPPERNDTSFTMIYPRQDINNGSANLGANQTIQSDWIIFRGSQSAENFWIIWSISPVSHLESAKTEAFKHPKGGLTGQNLVAVKEFLRMKQLEVKVRVTRYKATQTAVVRGTGDLLLALAEFKVR